jgi:hypothetical protein
MDTRTPLSDYDDDGDDDGTDDPNEEAKQSHVVNDFRFLSLFSENECGKTISEKNNGSEVNGMITKKSGVYL